VQISGTAYINFNMLRDGWIFAEQPNAYIYGAAPSSGITSMSSLMTQPATTNEKVCQPFQGTVSYTMSRAVSNLLGLHLNVLLGYSTLAAITQGFLRGDCPLISSVTAQIGPLLAGGQAVGLMTSTLIPKGIANQKYVDALPTLAEVFAKNPGKTKSAKAQIKALISYMESDSELLFTQTGVAAYKLDALRAAAKFALSQTSVVNTILNAGQNPKYTDPVKAKATFETEIPTWEVLSCYAGLAASCPT
jgi:hypothetical protein